MNAPADEVDPHARNWMWRTIQIVLQNVFVFWLRYRIHGRDRLPSGGALLLVNHQSSLDPLLVGASLKRPVSYLARHGLFARPVIGTILRGTYVMPIRRESAGSESIRQCVSRLEQGYYVGVFPEGTRSEDGRLQEIKPGFLAIARRARVPVIPVCVAGANRAYPRGAALLKSRTVRVVVGEPFSIDEVAALAAKGREAEFLSLVSERMRHCLKIAERWTRGIPPPH